MQMLPGFPPKQDRTSACGSDHPCPHLNRWRRPEAFCVAIWSGSTLCGLTVGSVRVYVPRRADPGAAFRWTKPLRERDLSTDNGLIAQAALRRMYCPRALPAIKRLVPRLPRSWSAPPIHLSTLPTMKALLHALLGDRDEPTVDIQVQIPWSPQALESRGTTETADPSTAEAMPLDLHPNARANFDEKAEALLAMLVTGPADAGRAPSTDPTGANEPFVSRLPDHAIASGVTVFRDFEGSIVARCFEYRGEIIGLQDDGYRALRKVAEGLQRTTTLRGVIGVDSLEALIFRWLRARVVGAMSHPMSAEVLAGVADLVGSYELVLPLFRVQLPEPLQVGAVLLRTISDSDFARWEAVDRESADAREHREQLRLALVRERRRMQGFAAATVTLKGELEHVTKIARDAAEEAVSLLRLFSPAMLSPQARSFCALWGHESIQRTSRLAFSPERRSVTFGEFLETNQDFVWRITAERLRLIRTEVLDQLLQALYEGPETPFRNEVRSALVFYSKGALRAEPAEKLLAILIPLESLLLRTSSEPISENVSTRLAFAIGETRSERKRIAEVTRVAYGMRSAYVHHRRAVDDLEALETLREFLQYAWRFFLVIGLQVAQFHDQSEYLSVLDDRKFA